LRGRRSAKVPVRLELEIVRHAKKLVVSEKVADEGCGQRHLGGALGIRVSNAKAIGDYDRRMAGLVGQPDQSRSAHKHVEILHDFAHALHKNHPAALRLHELEGARDATVQFADLYGRNKDPQIRADYIAFLDDLETNFAKRTTAMLTDDRTNFDIETEVLRDRLNRENLQIEG